MRRFAIDILRYTVAVLMLPYALYKILGIQCTVMPFSAWQYPLEQLRSDQVMWAFLGWSYGLQLFLGIVEFIPCVLLFFRRTALAGAIMMLPVAASVAAINLGTDLWGYTKSLSFIVLGLDVALLFLHRDSLSSIFRVIFASTLKQSRNDKIRSLLALAMLITFVVYKANNMFFDRSMTNPLTGDWPSRHPFEWTLTNENIGDSTLPLRTIKMYFMPRNLYAEINDGPLNHGSSRYALDTIKHSLTFRRYWNEENKNDSYLMDGSFRYSISDDTLLLRGSTTQGTEHILIFLRRIINTK